MSLKTIDGMIRRITTNADKLNVLIHQTGMLILQHAKDHGDCTRALDLAKAMPASMRRTMLLAWFQKYTPIRVKLGDSEAVGFDTKYKALSAEDKLQSWDIAGADAEPFFKIAEDTPEEKKYDFDALVKMAKAISGRIDKMLEKGSIPDNDIDGAKYISRTIAGLNLVRPPVVDKAA